MSETFEEWVVRVFDHPGDGPEWCWDPDADVDPPPPADTVAFLTRLYLDPVPALEAYSDAQLARGLWFLASAAHSDHTRALLDPRVPLDARRDCIAATTRLFEKLFAPRCSEEYAHLAREAAHPLDTVCYMWWDLFHDVGISARELDLAVIGCLSATLEIDAVSCQVAALHGLGHWQSACPAEVAPVIARYLRRRDLTSELRRYAEAAAGGCVL